MKIGGSNPKSVLLGDRSSRKKIDILLQPYKAFSVLKNVFVFVLYLDTLH